MFQCFEKWFDSVSDGWNPITVRDVRRYVRSCFFLVASLVHLAVLASFYLLDTPEQGNPGEIIVRVLPTYVAMVYVTLLIPVTMTRSHMEDEFFTAVPLTPKQHLHGYLGTSCVLTAFFFVQALPFLAFPTGFPHGRLIQLGFLAGFLIVVQMVTLFILPFFIRVTSIGGVLVGFFGVLVIALPLLGIIIQTIFFTSIAILLMLLDQSELHADSPPLVAAFGIFFVEIFVSCLLACLPYQLSLRLFASRTKSSLRTRGVNLL